MAPFHGDSCFSSDQTFLGEDSWGIVNRTKQIIARGFVSAKSHEPHGRKDCPEELSDAIYTLSNKHQALRNTMDGRLQNRYHNC